MAKEQVTFEVKYYRDDQNLFSKGIFVDGKLFDWGIDEGSYREAMAMGPEYHRIIQADVARHFLESLSEFMNRRVTQEEVDQATKTGWINK
jgi:hypothetical protein